MTSSTLTSLIQDDDLTDASVSVASVTDPAAATEAAVRIGAFCVSTASAIVGCTLVHVYNHACRKEQKMYVFRVVQKVSPLRNNNL